MIVKAQNVNKQYRLGSSLITALQDVTFGIEEAEFIVIIGPSGSGKTTLLNLLGLIDAPTSGTIFFQGQDTSKLSRKERREIRFQQIGFVFQTFNLLPTLNARENVELPLAFRGLSQREQRAKATSLLEAVGLATRQQHRPKELSIGEMQRVAIARALVNTPTLILADEPTGELDSNTGSEIIELLLSLCRVRKTAVLVATHDPKMMDVAQRKYRIQDGVMTPID